MFVTLSYEESCEKLVKARKIQKRRAICELERAACYMVCIAYCKDKKIYNVQGMSKIHIDAMMPLVDAKLSEFRSYDLSREDGTFS